MSVALSLELFAEILWHIERERDTAHVLDNHALSREMWSEAKTTWSKAIRIDGPDRDRFLDAYRSAGRRPVSSGGTSAEGPSGLAAITLPTKANDSVPRTLEIPSYILALPHDQGQDPDETLPITRSSQVVTSRLPFAGETSAETLAALKAASAQADDAPEGEKPSPEETLLLRSPLTTQNAEVGSFRDKISPVAIPTLSIDQYVQLRAKLALNGENDAATWNEFGILSVAARELLRARFVEYFRRDPTAQRHFVERLSAWKRGR